MHISAEACADDELVDRWRDRFGQRDALPRWKGTDPSRRAVYAFIAVAQDPAVLNRMDRRAALDLAAEAEAYARAVRGNAGKRSELIVGAAARTVAEAVSSWRKRLSARSRKPDGEPPPGAERTSTGPAWVFCRPGAPSYDEREGRQFFDSAARLGSDGLGRLPPQQALVVASGALRYCARAVRLENATTETPAEEQFAAALAAVQGWMTAAGTDPSSVLRSTGDGGKPEMTALDLARDASSCLSACRKYLFAGEQAPASLAFAAALRRQAFLAMVLAPGLLARPGIEDGLKSLVAEAALASVEGGGDHVAERTGREGAAERVAAEARAYVDALRSDARIARALSTAGPRPYRAG